MSRLSAQGRRKWRSRVAKERARVRARRILAKYFRAYRDAAMVAFTERYEMGLFADFAKPIADAGGFHKLAEHAPVALGVPAAECESCGAGPPLFEHVFSDCTMRYCSRCKADAIEAEEAHDD